MKKKLLLPLILLLLTATSYAINDDIRVVENPLFEVSKSGIYHISKIELSKTETKVYIHNTYIYNWWVMFSKDIFIKDCKTGKKYGVTDIEGGKFDEQIHMPKSGEYTVVLIFPALDRNITKIDYNNTIYGVSLLENNKIKEEKEIPKYVNQWIEEELNKVTTDPLKDYESPSFFNDSKALELPVSWCKRMLANNGNNHIINDVYASVLYAIGKVDKALAR